MKLLVLLLLFTIIVHHQRSISTILCNSIMTVAAAAVPVSTHHNYDGLYRFTKIVVEKTAVGGDIPIPNDDICTIQIRRSSSDTDTTSINHPKYYDIGIKIGNSMGGSATITPSTCDNPEYDEITMSGLRSTMMMPPPELYRIEMALSDLLPSVTNIQIKDDSVLTIQGPKGRIEATRQE